MKSNESNEQNLVHKEQLCLDYVRICDLQGSETQGEVLDQLLQLQFLFLQHIHIYPC